MSESPVMTRRTPVLYVFAVLASILSVQVGASFSKQLFPLIGAEGSTALRQAGAALCLCLLFQPWRGGPARKDWGVLLLYAVILGVMNLTFYMGIARIPLGIGVAIEFMGPLAVAILSSRRWSDAIWVACAIAGLLILVPWHGATAAIDPIGVFWCAVAGVCWGVYIIVGQKVSDRMHGGKAVAIAMAITTVFTLPIGMAHAGATLWQPHVLALGFGVAILSAAIPYTLEMLALKHIPAKTFGLMMSLEPAVGALVGFLILREHLSLVQWLAIGLVIIASAGSSLMARRGADVAEATP